MVASRAQHLVGFSSGAIVASIAVVEGPRNSDIRRRGQSTDDSRTMAVRSSTMVNLLVDGNMIARRVLRDRGTPRNTIGTYEYNPVSGGRRRTRRGNERRRCSMFSIRTKFDVPPAKIRGTGYELHPPFQPFR